LRGCLKWETFQEGKERVRDRGGEGRRKKGKDEQAVDEFRVMAEPFELPRPPVSDDAGRARRQMTAMAMKAPS
jgi:hypothetical protein